MKKRGNSPISYANLATRITSANPNPEFLPTSAYIPPKARVRARPLREKRQPLREQAAFIVERRTLGCIAVTTININLFAWWRPEL